MVVAPSIRSYGTGGCVRLRSQNCEVAASGGENCLAANNNLPSKMTKLLTPLMVASKCDV
jgi:hypothetical protein